jgi:sugar lactone lactonase YvrE
MRFLRLESSLVLLLAIGGCGEVVGAGGGGDDADAPTLASVSPDHGPLAGGTTVTVTGTGFTGSEAVVLVDGVLADGTVVSDTSLTFVTPPGEFGGSIADITVSTATGFAGLDDAFRYNETPVVIAISPAFARAAGGDTVTITGRGFENLEAGDPTVTIGGVEVSSVTVVDDDTLTATVGDSSDADPFSPQDLVVTNANGAATLEDAIKLTAPGLLATERNRQNNRVVYLNPQTGHVAEIGRMDRAIHACAINSGGTLYGLSRSTTGRHDLVTFDPLTGEVTLIGVIRDGGGVQKNVVSMSFVGATLYGWTRDDNRLVSINTSSGIVTLIGATNLAISRPNAMAFRDSGQVFIADSISETLDTLNITTGALTVGPSLAQPCCSNFHGAVTSGGALYLAEYSGQRRVMTVNTTSGAMSEVARLPMNTAGLCPTPPSF